MSSTKNESEGVVVDCFDRLAQLADYSLLNALQADPESTESGEDYFPRQVFSGHYVPVKPMPISKPEYVSHSATLFAELGFDDALAHSEAFKQLFSGDMAALPAPMKRVGWATGYALSIYGTEYTQQCPFQTGNGYGDGRAVSVLELVSKGKRWEFQLKGGGRTPYCRGADGRAVLRSSVREFLAQEHMHALGIQTSRSLCLFTSLDERVDRPWYTEGATHPDPNILVSNPVAISTRVAPSFLRVGQIELFGRRARSNAHPNALRELEMIVLHLIDREYPNQIDAEKPIEEKVIELVSLFRDRLIELVTHWIRVGFCQGNFNSDNCAGGGFTLDYGPFGFCEMFDPYFQPWTGGGRHFSFLNQPAAAKENFMMLCIAVKPLLETHAEALKSLEDIQQGFASLMQCKLDAMWAQKLGVSELDQDLFVDLIRLMANTPVDFNMFFRELSGIPHDIEPLVKSFYREPPAEMKHKWEDWLSSWHQCIGEEVNLQALSEKMKQVNPKYTWREWLVVPAYQSAMEGDYSLIEELKTILSSPYDEQTADIEAKYYRLRPSEFYRAGGVSHYSCSS